MLEKVNVITTRTHNGMTIEVFDFADTWIVEGQDAPANWHELVYRITKDGKKVSPEKATRAARIGDQLVRDLKQYRTPEGQNAFIVIQEWLNS